MLLILWSALPSLKIPVFGKISPWVISAQLVPLFLELVP
jgi:hypothetical protein